MLERKVSPHVGATTPGRPCVVVRLNPVRATTTTASTVPSAAAAAQTYLDLITPVNTASDTFASEAARWNSQTTDSQAENTARPVISALQGLKQKLLNMAWPTSAQQDVKNWRLKWRQWSVTCWVLPA